MLGSDKVPERAEYDHVGIKNCLYNNFMPRTEERISKGRRAFNAISGLGIKKKGITMATCSALFWFIIVPIVTYGSETWVLKADEVDQLRKFQRYIGRRCQRFPKRTPNYSAYTPLGWMSLDRVIQVKKLMFLRTITVMEDNDVCKRILVNRSQEYVEDVAKGRLNEYSSPVFDLINTCSQVGLYDVCMRMIRIGCNFSKEEWRKIVWEKVWMKEDDDCEIMYKQPHQSYLLFGITDKPYYLMWWILADLFPRKTGMCEIMASLVCDASLLKANDYRLKRKSHSHKICVKCELGIVEDIKHVVMQCPYYSIERQDLYDAIGGLNNDTSDRILREAQNYFQVIMGKQPEYATFQSMLEIWILTGERISRMYRKAIEGRP